MRLCKTTKKIAPWLTARHEWRTCNKKLFSRFTLGQFLFQIGAQEWLLFVYLLPENSVGCLVIFFSFSHEGIRCYKQEDLGERPCVAIRLWADGPAVGYLISTSHTFPPSKRSTHRQTHRRNSSLDIHMMKASLKIANNLFTLGHG